VFVAQDLAPNRHALFAAGVVVHAGSPNKS
jgi:hypothetical protein